MKISKYEYQNVLSQENVFLNGFDDIFNNILTLTNHVFAIPISQINIHSEKSHWRKTPKNLHSIKLNQIPDKSELFTKLTRNKSDFFEVSDFAKDKNIAEIIEINNELVINKQAVKYYAAFPIILSNNQLIGTLSLFDIKTNKLSAEQQLTLALITQDLSTQIECKLSQISLDAKLHSNDITPAPNHCVSTTKQQLNDEIDELFHRLVHDLKSPLNAIKNVSSWIEEDIESGETSDHQKHFSLIKNSVSRMQYILNDVREYSQIKVENTPAENIDLKTLLNQCSDVFEHSENFQINIQSCEITLPKEPLLFVLNQVISNAIKHHDKPNGIINVTCSVKNKSYNISVSDDGPGIPSKYENKIFTAFQKLKSKDEVEGSGLGLTMARKMLNLYGAEICLNFDDDKPCGATFIINWPN